MTLIPHSKPSLGPEELRAVTEVLRSGQITAGPMVAQFERGMAAYIGLHGGVAVSSGKHDASPGIILRIMGKGATRAASRGAVD